MVGRVVDFDRQGRGLLHGGHFELDPDSDRGGHDIDFDLDLDLIGTQAVPRGVLGFQRVDLRGAEVADRARDDDAELNDAEERREWRRRWNQRRVL